MKYGYYLVSTMKFKNHQFTFSNSIKVPVFCSSHRLKRGSENIHICLNIYIWSLIMNNVYKFNVLRGIASMKNIDFQNPIVAPKIRPCIQTICSCDSFVLDRHVSAFTFIYVKVCSCSVSLKHYFLIGQSSGCSESIYLVTIRIQEFHHRIPYGQIVLTPLV